MITSIFSAPRQRIRLKRPRRMRVLLPLALGVLVCALAIISLVKHFGGSERQQVAQEQTIAQESQPAQRGAGDQGGDAGSGGQTAEKEPTCPQPPQDPVTIVEKTVQPGQTITAMLADFLRPADVYALSRQAKEVYPLRKIKAGHPYRLKLQNGRLLGFEYEIDAASKLCVNMQQGVFEVSTKAIAYDARTVVVDGAIDSNLFQAIAQCGESAQLALKLADIFAWDVDFIHDIRSGDRFRLVVEKRYRRGEFCTYGPIVAAEFTNQDRNLQAFLFETSTGRSEYFNPSGQAMRKTFLKAPLNFTRISSGYSHSRKHPILNVVRPHLGIDYAASTGTPIKSVADGVVIARAYGKGGGNYIKVRHPNGYVTVYNHLSRYARGMKQGTRVSQGQVIGYVGSTGLATGPHLDYRVKKHGSYINPLKIDSEPAQPVPEKDMHRFRQAISPLQAVLEGKNPLYAQAGAGQEDASQRF